MASTVFEVSKPLKRPTVWPQWLAATDGKFKTLYNIQDGKITVNFDSVELTKKLILFLGAIYVIS